jgi:ABC-type sugar transport system substrate-binding protein
MSGEGSYRRRNSRRTVGLLAVTALVALSAAACGSSGGSGSSGSSSSAAASSGGGSAAVTAGLAKAKALLATLGSPSAIKFPGPTTAVNPGVHKVAVIAAGLGNPGASTLAPYTIQAIKAIGWTSPPVYDGKFTVSTEAQDIEDALNGGAQALFLIAITPSAVQSALAPALAKKMPVLCLDCGAPTDPGQLPGVTDVEDSTTLAGQLQAAYVTVQSGGHGKVALFNDPEYPNVTDRFNAAVAALKVYCPDCTVTTSSITLAQVLAPGVPAFVGYMTAHPKGTMGYVIAPYDGASGLWSTAAAQAGRTEIKFVGYAALPPFYGYISAGTPVGAAASVVIPVPYYGWAGVDLAARIFNNMPTWSAINLPDTLVTQANGSTFATFAKANGGVAGFTPANFEANFEKLWGRPATG